MSGFLGHGVLMLGLGISMPLMAQSQDPGRERETEGPAESVQQDSLLAEIINEAAESWAEGEVQSQVIGKLDARLASYLEKENSQYVSRALTLYSLGKGADSYGKARSEQERYYAGMNMVADGLTLFAATAPAGFYMKWILLGQGLTAGYLNKEEMKKLLQVYVEIQKLNNEALEIHLDMVRGEYAFAQSVLLRAELANRVAGEISEHWKRECESGALRKEKQVLLCLGLAEKIVLAKKLAARLYQRLLETPYQSLHFEAYLEKKGTSFKDVEELWKELEHAIGQGSAHLARIRGVLEGLAREHAESRLEVGVVSLRAWQSCLRETKEISVPLLASRKSFDLKDPVELAFWEISIQNAQESFQQRCGSVLNDPALPERSRTHLLKVQKGLQSQAHLKAGAEFSPSGSLVPSTRRSFRK